MFGVGEERLFICKRGQVSFVLFIYSSGNLSQLVGVLHDEKVGSGEGDGVM